MMKELLASWTVLLHLGQASAQVAGTARAGAVRVTHPLATSAAEKNIDRFCDGLVPMTKKGSGRLFGLVQKDDYEKGRWSEFMRESDLKAAAEAERVFDVARVWSRADGAIAVTMTLTSGSGDWFHLVEYCFRADGTLARMNSTLNTFNAVDKDPEKDVSGASRYRKRHFDGTGKQISVTKRILDLQTKRPAPTLQVMDDDEPIYKTANALPFFALLKVRGAAQPGVAPDGASPRR